MFCALCSRSCRLSIESMSHEHDLIIYGIRWFYLSLSRLHFSTIQISVHLVAKMAILLCSPVPRRATNGTTINSHPARWRPSSRFWMRRHVAARAASLVSFGRLKLLSRLQCQDRLKDNFVRLAAQFVKLRPSATDFETASHKLNQIMTTVLNGILFSKVLSSIIRLRRTLNL